MPAIQRRRGPMHEINIVPYVDVMLVLLVIFMVTAPLVTPAIIDLPTVDKASAPRLVPIEVFVKADEELVVRLAGTHTALVSIEENAVAGGAGSAVIELLANCGSVLPTLTLGIPDRFIEHGSREDCLSAAELDLGSLESAVRRFWERVPHAKAVASGT